MRTLGGGRPARYPTADETFHCFGDTHFLSGGIGNNPARGAHILWDLATGDVPRVPVHLQLGDGTDNAASSADAAALAFAAQLADPTLWVLGNHDVNMAANSRTPAAWAGVYGTPGASQNYVSDVLPWARIIAVGFDSMADGNTWIRLSNATLNWLDAQLTAAGSRRCYIACHAPLADTVLGVATSAAATAVQSYVVGGSGVVLSGTPGWPTAGVTPPGSGGVLDVLAAHDNVAAWISGHTHSSIESPDIVKTVTLPSGKKIAAINTSCVYFTDSGIETWDRIATPYISDLGDRIEVRWRDHGQKQWIAPWNVPSLRVMTATGLTAG